MVGVAKKLMDKAGKEGKPWISGLYDYRVTPHTVKQHHITIVTTDTVHTKEEKPAPTAKHSRHPRNVPNMTGTHEEVREQTRKELH